MIEMRNFVRKILLLASTVMLLPAGARTVTDLFVAEPGELFKIINVDDRRQLTDYIKNMPDTIGIDAPNLMGERSILLYAEDNYMVFHSSNSRTVELALMTRSKKDSVIVVVETYFLPSIDTEISFYDTSWQKLSTDKYFTMPQFSDLLQPSTPDDIQRDLRQKLPYVPIVVNDLGDGDHTTMTVSIALNGALTEADEKLYEPYLQTLTYRWKGNKFKLETK